MQQKMKGASFCFLIGAFALGFTSCAKPKETHIDVTVDAEKRSLEVVTYIVGNNGAKIRHGESLQYNWASGTGIRDRYRDGKLIGGDFESSSYGGSAQR